MWNNKEIETSIKDIQKIMEELDCRKNINLEDIKQEIKTLNETMNISLREIQEILVEIQETKQIQNNLEKNDEKCFNEFKPLIYIISNSFLIILFFCITECIYKNKIFWLSISFMVFLVIANFFFIWKKQDEL